MADLCKIVREKIGTIDFSPVERLEQYRESIKPYNQTAQQYLGQLRASNGVLTHLSPLICIQLIQSKALPRNTTLATRNALELAEDFREEELKGVQVNFGLTLWTGEDNVLKKNDLIARTLAEDLRKRSIDIGNGVLIPFEVLRLRENSNSPYGVVARLSKGDVKDLILPLEEFKWGYVGSKQGVKYASLNRGSGWVASYEHLGGAYCNSRVVEVSGEATPRKFLREIDNIAKQQRKQAA